MAPPAGAPRGAPRPRHVAQGTVVDGKYRIERVLGEGGMGIVYLAVDVHTGVEVVLKAIRNELAHRPDMRERTLAEGRVIARIDHPNVVHLKAVVIDAPVTPGEGESLWLVMQFVDGESLEERITRHAREHAQMPVPEVLRILAQVLAGMGAVHKGGIIHRDLKPGNILIRASDGVAKVSDFGIAKGEEDARAGRGQTRGIIGSLWYMSPEQVTGRRDLDKRVDVYALGIMLYEMLIGHVPFDAEDDQEIMRMHAAKPVPLVSASAQTCPAGSTTSSRRRAPRTATSAIRAARPCSRPSRVSSPSKRAPTRRRAARGRRPPPTTHRRSRPRRAAAAGCCWWWRC
ncbi:MAG: serine/threonine-protein kinase [Polyangiaceae bacterium]